MSMTLTKTNFIDEVTKSQKPVLIDFYADWCAPCRMLGPTIEEISNENPGFKICKVNIDHEPELARQFKVMSIPTLLVLKNGNVVNKAVGAHPKKEILKMLDI